MRTRISPQPEPDERSSLDTAVVLSGGSVNGIYLQLGFLQALRASDLWRRIGWVYGTSAGALSGWATAMDALDEHEEFLMGLQSEDVFAANDIWRAPFVGLHRYSLPDTVRERLGNPVDLARRVQEGGRELTVVTTDVGLSGGSAGDDTLFERAFSSARETPETLADAIFASAAISTFVLPMRIGDSVYADGGWVRNFPLAYAYAEPGVETIVGCRYRPSPAGFTGKGVQFWHERMSRLARIKVARAVTAELRDAIERQDRGEPMHLVDTIARLSHIAVYRNSDLEVLRADERDDFLLALDDVRARMRAAIEASTRGRRRTELLRALDESFASADFPFAHSRVVPRLVVDVATPDGTRLDISRRPGTWSEEAKRVLITHGRTLTEDALRDRAILAA